MWAQVILPSVQVWSVAVVSIARMWYEVPMLGFDLETTTLGDEPNPHEDRIVSYCLVELDPGHQMKVEYQLVDPGVPISPGSTEIHGITDEMVQKDGIEPARATDYLVERFSQQVGLGCSLAGMNLSYDLTVVDGEAARHGVNLGIVWPDIRPVLDLYVLDKQIDPFRRTKSVGTDRKLPSLCEHYGVAHNGAHNAQQDVMATLRCLWKIGQLASRGDNVRLFQWYNKRKFSYRDPGQYSGSTPYLTQTKNLMQIGKMTLEEIHAAQMIWRMDQMLSLQNYLRTKGKQPSAVCDGRWPVIPRG
jgi:DNA polymerase-3 subunit epsilon